MKDIVTNVKEITRINLTPDEVLLIHMDEETNMSTMNKVLEQFKKLFPNNKIIAISGNVKLEAVKGV